jgi:hypothetical protein
MARFEIRGRSKIMSEPTRLGPGELSAVGLEAAGRERFKLSWGAIFGGAVAAFGLWLLLYVFGLAVGLSTINPRNAGSLRGSGMFTGIWALLAPLAALFVGGWVAGRGGGLIDRAGGAIHGLIVWGLAALLGAGMVAMVMSAVASGIVSVGKTVAGVGGEAIGAVASQAGGATAAAQQLGINSDDLLGPVNQRLEAEGKPTVSAAELQSATRDVAKSAVATGHIDRDMLVQSLARNTNLTPTDAEQVADQVKAQYEQKSASVKERVHSAAGAAETGALQAAEKSGKALWGAFGAMLLGLVASVVGGALGAYGGPHVARRERRVITRQAPATPPRTPSGPPREVYP